MKRALTLATGAAVGYVAGTRAGREKYERMKLRVHAVGRQPAVVDLRENLQERAQTASKTVSKAVAGKVTEATSELAKKVKERSHGAEPSTPVVPAPETADEYPPAPTGIVPDDGAV
jgi:hypothetical protein